MEPTGVKAMLANRLAKYAALRGIYYGWVMAALAFFYVLFSSSALGITAVLIKPMSDQLGLTIGELSASQGLRFALFGLAAPFAGGLMLRYGPRRMVALSGMLSLLGLLLTATMTTRFQLWLGFGALLGLAPGLTALQLSAVALCIVAAAAFLLVRKPVAALAQTAGNS
jgi:MFS family permease